METEAEIAFDHFAALLINKNFTNNSIISIEETGTESRIHKLTHQHLFIKFWKVNVVGKLTDAIDYSTLLAFPFPIVIFNFIEKEWN